MSERTGFFNDNLNRSYPLVDTVLTMTLHAPDTSTTTVELPYSAIVDFGCVLGIPITYDPTVNKVFLSEISRDGDTITFEFTCTAVSAADIQLYFERDVADVEFAVQIAAAAPGTPDWPGCGTDANWDGFLVTGDMAALATLVPDGYRLTGSATTTEVEPALIQSLSGSFVRSLNLANVVRLRVTAPVGCPEEVTESDEVHIVETCMTGDLKLKAGYNTLIRQEIDLSGFNIITVGAGVGLGLGVPCEEQPFYADDEPPEGSDFYSGGPSCRGLVKTINGVGGKSVGLLAGTGVTIVKDGDSELTMKFDLHDLQACS